MHKSTIINIINIALLVFLLPAAIAEPRITADAAAVIDVKSGLTVYEKNAQQQRSPASLTKMMTAVIAVEYGDLRQEVTVGKKPPLIPPSKIYLKEGEKIRLEDLLKAALMRSANDACVAIAEHVGGSEEYFIYLMNLKAWALALNNTHFNNTNGLPAKNHYSTAVDLARLGVYVKKSPVISEYVSKKSEVIVRRGKEQKIGNTNKLLWSYPGANGIKTGTTNAAGKCLASSARIGDREFVGVILHSDNRYGDSIKILDYAFNNFTPRLLIPANKPFKIQAYDKSITGSTNKDIYYPYSSEEKIQFYIKAYGNQKKYKRGEKCALLAIVTQNSILWYDIYAAQEKQNLTNKNTILDYFAKYLQD